MGLNCPFTPTINGRLLVTCTGVALNTSGPGNGVNIRQRYGTGTAPINGATTGLGTQMGIPQHFVASTAVGQSGFTVTTLQTGFTIGTALWFDLSLEAVTAGGASIKDVQVTILEV